MLFTFDLIDAKTGNTLASCDHYNMDEAIRGFFPAAVHLITEQEPFKAHVLSEGERYVIHMRIESTH